MRLRNRGFMKYVIMKLFSKITHAQRNELLKTDTPFSNICELITFQEAERRLIWDGETVFALSQGKDADEASSVPRPQTSTTTRVSAATQPTEEAWRKLASIQGLLLSKVGSLSSPSPAFHIKNSCKHNR